MANTLLLRSFVCDRLSAAAEEIFAVVERTMIEYEVDILRSKREIHRQRKLLDIALNPQLKLKRTETKDLSDNQHCAVELSLNLSQHHTEPQGHIKEEHEELITSHVGEQLQELEQLDAVTSRSTSTYIPSGGDKPEPLQSAHLFQTIKVEETDSQLHAESVKESSGTYTIVDSTSGIQVLPAPIPERSTGTSNCTSGIVDWMGSSQASSNIVKVRSRRNRQRKAVLGRDALGRRTYKCPACAKSFNSSGAFSKHLDMHEGVRYQCPHCGKTFGRTDHLKTHMFIHAGVKPFSCMECGKCFRLKTGLKEHIKTHTGDRPFPCGVCGKRFFSASDHKRHQRSHTGEKPYMCSVCNKSFRYTTDVKRHMSNFHPANLKD